MKNDERHWHKSRFNNVDIAAETPVCGKYLLILAFAFCKIKGRELLLSEQRSAYITMKGVMMPGVSAGSNQVGASDICTPQVGWPCGAAAPASRGKLAAATPSAAPAIASRRLMRAVRKKWRTLLGWMKSAAFWHTSAAWVLRSRYIATASS
jgi:hypothetical protein